MMEEHGSRGARYASAGSHRDRCAIAGIGATEFSRDSGRSALGLAVDAAVAAARDAGIEVRDIDGVVRCDMDEVMPNELVAALGLPSVTHWSTVTTGGTAPAAMVGLEAYGFCKAGEGGPYAEGGAIARGGELPINTSGGHLSEGYIHGMNHVVEGVRQIRGTSTSQVPDAETCLVSSAPVGASAMILTIDR